MYMKFIFFVLFAIFSIVCCAQLYITRHYNLQIQDICQIYQMYKNNNVESIIFNRDSINTACTSFYNQQNKWTEYFSKENISKIIFIKNIIKT